MNSEGTHFIAVDIDVESQSDPSPLATGLGAGAFLINSDSRDDVHRGTFELDGSPSDAEEAIRRFISLLERLPADALGVWRGAQRRTFNVGVQAGASHSYELAFSSDLLRVAAEWGAKLVITVYGARPADSPTGENETA